VRPSARGRGIGRLLLAWQEGRGMQQLATSTLTLPGRLMAGLDVRADSARRLFERFGFEAARYYLELHRDLSEPIAELPRPEGVSIERFSPAWSAATLAARNASFRDHWGSQPVTDEQWATFLARENFRADWSYLAAVGDEVVGFSMCDANTQDWELQGFTSCYVDLVGTTRDWRKRGIAAAVLTSTLAAVAADGIDRVVLDVDSDSPTGAVGLYERLGFAETNRSITYVREF
jgi:mycothiol synthase